MAEEQDDMSKTEEPTAKRLADDGRIWVGLRFGGVRVIEDDVVKRDPGVEGLPADVVQRVNDALQKAIESDEFKSFVAVSLVAPAFLNASDYRSVVDAERAIYARVVPKLALDIR